jgi:PKD domain-containing protein
MGTDRPCEDPSEQPFGWVENERFGPWRQSPVLGVSFRTGSRADARGFIPPRGDPCVTWRGSARGGMVTATLTCALALLMGSCGAPVPGLTQSSSQLTSSHIAPSVLMERAAATIDSGAVPISRGLTCSLTVNGLAGSCSGGTQGPHPRTPPILGFLRSTYSPTSPPAAGSATLAWDALDHVAVLFGGNGTDGPLATTWIFNGTWKNITSTSGAPPARYGAAMDYDTESQEVVLFGGCGAQCPLGDTWTFRSGAWTNETGPLGGNSPAAVFDSALVDFGNQGALLFGGCTDRACTSQSSSTEWFATNSSCPTAPAPCWEAFSGPSPSARAGVALGFYPPTNDAVLYGGYAGSGVGQWHDRNDTWVFSGAEWQNYTPRNSPVPPARSYASFFYYATPPFAGQLFLYGGYNQTTGTDYREIWAVLITGGVGSWSNASSYPLPSSRERPAFASTAASGPADNYTALVVGGSGEGLGLRNDTWVFETDVVLNASVSPLAAETNQVLTFRAGEAGGTHPTGLWTFGDGDKGSNLTAHHRYEQNGTYNATVTATDAWGIQNQSSFLVTVHSPSLVLHVPKGVDVGIKAVFNGSIVNGTKPYTYNWSLGTLGSILQPNANNSTRTVSANYTESGTQNCSLEVTDSTTSEAVQNFTVDVNPDLASAPTFSPSSPQPGANVSFNAGLAGGTSPFNYSWDFGDGARSVLSSPTHVYSAIGTYVVQLWVNDSVNGSVYNDLTVSVSKPSAPPVVIDWSRLVIPVLAVGVIVAIFVFLAIHGRRRRPPTDHRPAAGRAGSPTPTGGGPPSKPPARPPTPPAPWTEE